MARAASAMLAATLVAACTVKASESAFGSADGATATDPTVSTTTPSAESTGGSESSATSGAETSPTGTAAGETAAPECGNGVVEGTEACDAEDFAETTCESLGFFAGSLVCAEDCTISTDECHDCGDGTIGTDEACEPDDLAGQTCEGLGLGAGTLGCLEDCSDFDTAECGPAPVCGDGMMDADEQCDGTDFGVETCMSQGFDQGNLTCTGNCTINTSSCTNLCAMVDEPCSQAGDCCNTGCGAGGMFCFVNGQAVCCT